MRIPLEKPRFSVCVSSQVGCALGCTFCETGRLGFLRNLEPWEMVEQALTVRRESPERPLTGVVFQGQGEPFQNYDNVIRAARILRDPSGPRIGSDRITISTVGLLPQIERYTDEGHPYRLILSLTSAFSEKRARLVPVTARYGVPELAAAMRRHAARARRAGEPRLGPHRRVQHGAEEARELARLFRGVPVRLSVIDVNDPTGRFERATDEERGRFLSALADHGLGFVRRYSGGPDIDAACGMLASRARGGSGPRAARRPGRREPPHPAGRRPRRDRGGGRRPAPGRARGLPHRDRLRPRRQRLRPEGGGPRLRGEGAARRSTRSSSTSPSAARPGPGLADRRPARERPRRALLARPAHAGRSPAARRCPTS